MPLRTIVNYYLMFAPHVFMAGVPILLWRRGLYRQFPLFFVYIADELAQFVVFVVMIMTPSVTGTEYGVAYGIGLALSTTLRFGVIHEIFGHAFRNYAAISRFSGPAFRWGTVGTFAAGIALALYTGGNQFNRFMLVVNLLDRTASIAQCALLLGLFVFAAYMGLSLRSHVFGLALGLGIYATVTLAAAAIRTQFAYVGNTALNYITMVTYHVCVVIWIVYLWAPEHSTQYAVTTVPEHDLEAWNKELQRLTQQ